jgi:hypothetical protein
MFMKGFRGKQVSAWLLITLLILSSFGSLKSPKSALAQTEKVQLGIQTQQPKMMSNLPFDLESAVTLDNEQQQVTQQTAVISFPQNLTDWMLDKETSLIYAISETTNKLYFMDKQTLAITNELQLSGKPTDLHKYGNKLFISQANNLIQSVDIPTKALDEQFPTVTEPLDVAVSATHIFIAASWPSVYSIDRTTKAIKNYNIRMTGHVDVQVGSDNRTLYLADRQWSSSDFYTFDTVEDKILSVANDGFNGPTGEIILDEQSAFFAGYRMNKNDLSDFLGEYQWVGNDLQYYATKMLSVSSNYVLTTQGIYDKNTYLNLATLPFQPTQGLLEEDGSVILFKSATSVANNKVYRYSITLNQNLTVQMSKLANTLESNYTITDWITDEESPYIYMISEKANALTVIRKSDYSVIKSVWIGSRPVEVEIHNGKVYIAFTGESYIAQFNIADTELENMGLEKRLVKGLPTNIEPYNEKIFYTIKGDSRTIRVLTVSNEHQQLPFYTAFFHLDPQEEALYVMGSTNHVKVNPTTHSVILTGTYGNAIFDERDELHKDGDSLYFGYDRISAKDLSTDQGSYPESVLYVKDELVFGSRAIYDRDTFTKIIDLPTIIDNAYVVDDQSIILSSENKLIKYDNLEDADANNISPRGALFIDTDDREGWVTGYLAIVPTQNANTIQSYNAYFADGLNKFKLNMVLESQNNGVLMYRLLNTYSTPGPYTFIGIHPVIQGGVEQNQYASATIWDSPTYLANNFQLTNTNFTETGFSGTITWDKAFYQPFGSIYQISFMDTEGFIGDPIATVNADKLSYSVDLTNVPIPIGAIGLGISLVKSNGEEPPYFEGFLFEQLLSPAPLLQNITITNNESSDDTVTVTGITAGDIIRVYNEAESNLLGEGTVGANQTSVTITIPDIGTHGQKVSVTRETIELYESFGTLVAIPYTIGTEPPPVVTPPPGETTPPPVIVIPPPSGGTVPPASGPAGSATPTPKLEAKEQDLGGKKVSVAEVDEDYMKYLTEQSDFSFSKTILLKLEKQEANAHFQLAEKTVKFLSDKDKDSYIEVETSFGKIKLPVAPIMKNLNSKTGDQTITLAVEQATSDYTTKLTSQLKGSTPIGKPVEFKVLSNGTELQNFDQYLEHQLTINVGKVSEADLVGLTYDAASRTYIPVPAKFMWENGVLTASLYRKGNSVYTVVKNKVTLKDLPKTTEYKESIQKLANRTIISGFANGTFKPEQSVSRAEFAKMLNRALGIQVVNTTKSKFKDVKANQWYTAQVEAAVKAGLINGFADGTFRPNQKITHKEMIVMVMNARHYLGGERNVDALVNVPKDVPSWARASYIEAINNGILVDENDVFSFKANKATNRGESALLIYRLLEQMGYMN